jgi:uncharacterized protein YjbI with pentapeptide repeats
VGSKVTKGDADPATPDRPSRRVPWRVIFEWNGWSAVTSLATAFAAIFAVVVTLQSLQVTQEGQLADRFSKSIEQLGSEKLDVRLGGIYALESIARDSSVNHASVLEVLSAYVREHSPASSCPTKKGLFQELKPLATDVQAVITVLGRRRHDQDVDALDLHGTCLQGVRIKGANFDGANIGYSDLRAAKIEDASFRGANLETTYIHGAQISRTDFSEADLSYSDAQHSELRDLKFVRARMVGVKFMFSRLKGGADLSYSDLTIANLSGIEITGVNFTGAKTNGLMAGLAVDKVIGLSQWPPPSATCVDRDTYVGPPGPRMYPDC